MRVLVLAFLIAMSFIQCAKGDFVLRIGDGTPLAFNAGSTGTISVFAYNSTPGAPFNFSGYSLAFDVGGDGNGIPGNSFSAFTPSFSSGAFGAANGDIDTAPFLPNAYDLAISNSGTQIVPMPSSGSAVRLFDLQFSIASNTAGGFYGFTFVPNATTGGFAANSISGDSTAGVNLGFETGPNLNGFTVITAVPESTSFVFAGIAFAGVAFRQFRKRKATPTVV